ncbi:hypothetical protein ACOCJ7_00255 [Knoellia sp. CPCC 206453]|uniref:hypothetical protein n=1 Tax=Knoellia pratensis TaxID=3404796 RepID=UPI00361711D0
MGEAETHADVRADAVTTSTGASTVPAATSEAAATETTSVPRDWMALIKRMWPFAGMVLAAILWWPVAFSGTGEWMTLPVSAKEGSFLFLGTLVGAAVVSALVTAPWPRFGIAFGLTALGWVMTGVGPGLPGERTALAALAGLGLLLGLWVGARAHGGPVAVATFLAMVAGLSPATWGRGPLLAVAVALPFWIASKDRVAPTILALVRVVVTWLGAVLIAIGLRAGWFKLSPGVLGDDPLEAAKVVGSEFVKYLRENWSDIVEASARAYTGWIWLAVVLAIAFVVAAALVKRQRTKAS